MKVGFLGPKGTFSYEICNKYYKNEIQKIEYKTITDCIIALENNQVNEVIVPIENSIQGCVTEALDNLIEYKDIKVKDESFLEIKQNLMSNRNCDLKDIKKVYSHPQALAQCREFLIENSLLEKIISVESTGLAAQIVSNENDCSACICNMSCLEEYNLKLLKSSIQDNDYNKTKFWILSKNENDKITKNKMSMIFSVKDKPGALYNVLRVFNKYELNLTKIESRPAKTVFGEYYFLIDVVIGNNNEDYAINEILNNNIFVRILGKY